jgi:hypothetical protein
VNHEGGTIAVEEPAEASFEGNALGRDLHYEHAAPRHVEVRRSPACGPPGFSLPCCLPVGLKCPPADSNGGSHFPTLWVWKACSPRPQSGEARRDLHHSVALLQDRLADFLPAASTMSALAFYWASAVLATSAAHASTTPEIVTLLRASEMAL